MSSPARFVFYLFGCVLLGACLSAVMTLTPKAARALDSLDAALVDVHAIETNTTRLEAEASGLLNTSRQVVLVERSAAAEQIKQIDLISKQTTALIEHADATVTDLDSAVKQTLAGAATDEADVSTLLRQTATSLREVGDRTNMLLESATTAIDVDDAHKAMADVATSTQNLAAATGDAAAAMATVRHGVEVEVAQLTAPPRKLKWLTEEAARIVGKFFGY